MSGCPSSRRLQDWLADRLTGPEAESVGAHVEGCAGCQQALEQLTGGADQRQPVTVGAAGAGFLRRLEQEPPAGCVGETSTSPGCPSWQPGRCCFSSSSLPPTADAERGMLPETASAVTTGGRGFLFAPADAEGS
jgi:hypothetical protein